VQNLYGQAKDVARDATDAAVSYAKDAYEDSGDTFRDGSQAVEEGAGQSARFAVDRRRYRLCVGAFDDAPAAPPAAALAVLRLSDEASAVAYANFPAEVAPRRRSLERDRRFIVLKDVHPPRQLGGTSLVQLQDIRRAP
jgi:hypothetical protein